jgi:hypothetical protein
MEATPPPRRSSPSTAYDAWHRACDGTLRRDVWPSALGLLDTTSAESIRIPGHYHALLALAGETPETAQQIEKDLPRTGATFAVQGLLKPGERGRSLILKTQHSSFFNAGCPPPPNLSWEGKKQQQQRRERVRGVRLNTLACSRSPAEMPQRSYLIPSLERHPPPPPPLRRCNKKTTTSGRGRRLSNPPSEFFLTTTTPWLPLSSLLPPQACPCGSPCATS